MEIVPIERIPYEAVEALLDRAFGPDRHGRTAYRLREGARAIPGVSLAAIEDDRLVGTIQLWRIAFVGDDNRVVPMTLIGPVAVVPDRQRDGLGRRLMEEALAAAARVDLDGALTLIGDPEYYGRFFGFSAQRTAGWRLPGVVERHRLLARGDAVPATAGVLRPAE